MPDMTVTLNINGEPIRLDTVVDGELDSLTERELAISATLLQLAATNIERQQVRVEQAYSDREHERRKTVARQRVTAATGGTV